MDKETLQNGLKTIRDGLIGKQNTNRYQRPHFTIRPLAAMLRDLVNMKPVDWYAYAFSREPLNGKFTDEQRIQYTKEAIACGVEYAQKIMKQYGSKSPVMIAEKMGMEVSYPDYPEKTDRVLFGEFKEPNKIMIYMDAVNKASKSLKEPGVKDVLTSHLNVKNLLLAHELFHNVEDKYRKEIYTRTKKIRLWHIGPLHNDSEIFTLGEIAGMAFAQELCGLPYSPFVMDVFLVYGYSPEEASGLYEEIMERSGMTPCDADGNHSTEAELTVNN